MNALVIRQGGIKDCRHEFGEIQGKIEKGIDSSDDEAVALQDVDREVFEARYFETLGLISN